MILRLLLPNCLTYIIKNDFDETANIALSVWIVRVLIALGFDIKLNMNEFIIYLNGIPQIQVGR